VTPAEFADRIGRVASRLESLGETDYAAGLRSLSGKVRRHASPEVVGAMAILVRADLCRSAETFEKRAAELRAWAREIGEG